MDIMKILVCTPLYPPDIGGPATYSKFLFDELPKQGIDADVLVFRDVMKYPYIIRHVVYFFKILKKARGVDIIFAQDPLGVGMPSGLAAKISRKKFILKIVGDRAWETGTQKFGVKESLDEFSKNRFVNLFVFLIKVGQTFVAWMADKIITPSKYLKVIVSNWGVDSNKIQVVYNSFDAENTIESKEELRKKFELDDFVILSVSRLVPWKGFDTLVGIMPEIIKEIPEAKLLIVGSGPEYDNLKLKIENLKLSDSVCLLGQKSHTETLQYLKAGDLFVLNTAYEGFSHLILEAMSVGVPIITTNVGGNPEAILNKETGLLVQVNDKEQIKEAIVKLYKDKDLREKLSQNAREKVKEFSKERMSRETVGVLRGM